MAQGPSANPDKFSPPGPWGAGHPPTIPAAAAVTANQVDVPFVASATVVYTPTVDLGLAALSFIASATVVRALDLTGSGTVTFNASTTWTCPDGVYLVKVEQWGGGGGGYAGSLSGGFTPNDGEGGGGGGAYAENHTVPVTPGNIYTVTVGAGGATNVSGGASTFVGDGGVTVTAAGGGAASTTTAGPGGTTAASIGLVKFAGGDGGTGDPATNTGGASGGEAAGPQGAGTAGTNAAGGNQTGRPFGTGSTSGGDGGAGGDFGAGLIGGRVFASNGAAPGGGGGGCGGNSTVQQAGSGGTGRTAITFSPNVLTGFIASSTVVYGLQLNTQDIAVPFIGSATLVYAPTVQANSVAVPFISSTTTVHAIVALYTSTTGPGNGGETTPIQLSPNGAPETATVDANFTAGATALTLTGDSTLPATGNFLLTVDDEVLLVTKTGSGSYRIVQRPMSNTSAAAHTSGTTVTWGDTYDMAVLSTNEIASTIDYTVDGETYDAWLMSFDSTQAYLASSRYALAVSELVGVFPAGTGSTGTSKLDGPQPSAEQAPAGVTDDCPVGITQPARLIDDIEPGDVALLRYVNPEGSILTLGPRSSSIQSWYAFMRVDGTNVDVTTSDPNGNINDGSVNDEFFNSTFDTVTLPGTDRFFTYGPPHYSDKGWPIAALAIRQGTRRVPLWTSPDWHNFGYVYSGFSTDATYVQVLINQNGFRIGDPFPAISLPGPQDIDGPNATWDDGSYYSSVAWGVFLFKPNARTILVGPPVNPPPPTDPPPPDETIIPVVPPQPGGGSDVTPPVDIPEGGSGGDIYPPFSPAGGERFWVAMV